MNHGRAISRTKKARNGVGVSGQMPQVFDKPR